MHDVSVGAGRIALDGRVTEDLPADLEVVIAERAVPEIADRTEQLIAADVELANARRSRHEIVAEVFVSRRSRIVRVGPVEPVLADACLEEHGVADHRIPFAFVQARVQVLIERRIL